MKRLTHEKYVERVQKINPDVEVLEEYIGSQKKILHKCKIDGYEWYTQPSNILNGKGCPKCYGNIQKSHQRYVEEVALINPNVEVIGVYINNKTKILHKCKIDGYEWLSSPNHILKGRGCPKCYGRIKRTHEQYVSEVMLINPNIEVVGEYINSRTKILHKCKIDGHEWYAIPNSIIQGSGCPKCNESRGEKNISKWLDEFNILYQKQKIFEDCRDTFSLPYDFYLPKYNICIEYQGQQHYYPVEIFGGKKTFEKQQKHDNIKKEYCQKNNICLFEIPYYSNLDDELVKLYEIIKTQNIKKGVVA